MDNMVTMAVFEAEELTENGYNEETASIIIEQEGEGESALDIIKKAKESEK